MATLRTRAPAKINLGLEVLGRRADGYHDIVTLAQPIALYDDVSCGPADRLAVVTDPPLVGEAENLVGVAARALADRLGRRADVRFAVVKRIPLAAGLGGGSSDAAATLRLLVRLWWIDWFTERGEWDAVVHAAEDVGSDVPLFLRGGAVLVAGRGERVEPVRLGRTFWVALACPSFDVPHKTRALYAALTRADRSDGRATADLAAHLAREVTTSDGALSLEGRRFPNAFDRAASAVYPEFGALRRRLEDAAGIPLSLSGAGPSLYALFDAEDEAHAAAARMAALGVPTYAASAVTALPPIERGPHPPTPSP